MDDKTKEKSPIDEIKKKYGTNRVSKGMIVRHINEPKIKFATKLMECKLLRKCRKEEAPTRVVVVSMQCTKGSLLS
jgi:hypothetical protein